MTYRLDDRAWAAVEPLLPGNQPGARRVDDRRVVSGILHVPRAGCRWRDRPPARVRPAHDGPQPVQPLEPARGLGPAVRGPGRGGARGRGDDRQLGGEGAPVGGRGEGGAEAQAIGRPRGGRATEIHAVADGAGRPPAFRLSPGDVADATVAPALAAAAAPPSGVLIGDRGCDARLLRRAPAERGAVVAIPNDPTRRNPHPFDPAAYRRRDAIERVFCRLEDFRRVAARHDKPARNFEATVALAAAVTWWAD